MAIETTITWSYFKIDQQSMYFGFRWKKKAYEKTLAFVQQKLNQDIDKFCKKKKYLDVFDLTDEEKTQYKTWTLHVDIPKYEDVKDNITRKLVSKKFLKKTYLIECKLSCKVRIKLY